MTTILTKRLKKLRKELQYWQSELEYIQEVLNEWHINFEEYHRIYCTENNIDLAKLNRENFTEVKLAIPKLSEAIIEKKNNKDDTIKKIYKQLAKKIHPDAGGEEEEFKLAVNAYNEENIEKLLDMCDKHVILIKADKQMIDLIKEQIAVIKEKIKEKKSTYSWSLYSCDENEKCKENVVKKFLKQLFNYEEN